MNEPLRHDEAEVEAELWRAWREKGRRREAATVARMRVVGGGMAIFVAGLAGYVMWVR
jgi:hypothetical protein